MITQRIVDMNTDVMEILENKSFQSFAIIRGTCNYKPTEVEIAEDAMNRSIEFVLGISIFKSDTHRLDGTWDFEVVGRKG